MLLWLPAYFGCVVCVFLRWIFAALEHLDSSTIYWLALISDKVVNTIEWFLCKARDHVAPPTIVLLPHFSKASHAQPGTAFISVSCRPRGASRVYVESVTYLPCRSHTQAVKKARRNMSLSPDAIVNRLMQGDSCEPKKRLQNISTAMSWIQQELVSDHCMIDYDWLWLINCFSINLCVCMSSPRSSLRLCW